MADTEDSAAEAPPSSTTPDNLSVVVRDFENADVADLLGRTVLRLTQILGRSLDLSRLDGITIGIDYDEALSSLDRGMPGLRPLTRSDSFEMQGVAMSPAVMRDGVVRTHLVFNAAPLSPFFLPEEETTDDAISFAIGIVAHECAHVQVTAEKERAIPDCRLGTPIEGFERAVMYQVAEVCWDEYAVCRLSAPFASGQNVYHAQTVIGCASVARDQANDAIRRYRYHADVDRLIVEAGPSLCAPLKAAAYLLGGMDGAGLGWSEFADVREALEENDYSDLIDMLQTELRHLWGTQAHWPQSMTVFDGLTAIAKETFATGGMFFTTEEGGECHLDVPFTWATA